MRRELGRLLALNDSSPDWIDSIYLAASADTGWYYICTKCGSTGAHVLAEDDHSGFYYHCLECKGRGMSVGGGISSMFGIGENLNTDLEDVLFGNSILRDSDAMGSIHLCCCDPNNNIYVDGDNYMSRQFDGASVILETEVGGTCEKYAPGEEKDNSEGESTLGDGSGDGMSMSDSSEPEGKSVSMNTVMSFDEEYRDIGSDGDSTSSEEDVEDVSVQVKFHPDACDNCHHQRWGSQNSGDRSVDLSVVWLKHSPFT